MGAGPKESPTRAESVRCYPSDSRWIDQWTRESGQDRANVLRAAIRLLRLTLAGATFESRARLIAALSAPPADPADARAASKVTVRYDDLGLDKWKGPRAGRADPRDLDGSRRVAGSGL